MLPGGEKAGVGKVEGHLGDSQTDKAEAHHDGAEDADEEGNIVPPANALVQPFTVMVKHMDTLVTHGAVFGPAGADVDVAQVTSTVLNDMIELALVKLRHRPPGHLS